MKSITILITVLIVCWDSSVSMGWTTGVQYLAEAVIFFFSTESTPALRPTQLPIQWVPGALSLGVKQLGYEADNSPPSRARLRKHGHLQSHIYIHGVVLS
jgi:hypothetical protein